jgi:hypothetical protein
MEYISMWDRCLYSFALSVVFTGILMIIDMIFLFQIGDIIFSFWFNLLLFIFSYIIAPNVSQYLRYDRRSH